MLLQGDRVLKDFVSEWVEVGYNFLSDKDTPPIRALGRDGGAFRFSSDHPLCKDRWVVWRVRDDTIELSELSLHLNLTGNGLRLYFPNTAVLSPVVIVEESLTVSILIATTASVHRVICAHPSTQEMGAGNRKSAVSIFDSVDTTVLQRKHHFSYIPHDVAPSLATAALSQVGAAVFAFSYPSSDLRLVTLPPPGADTAVLQTDLHQWSVMQRLWSGVSRRSMMVESDTAPLSLVMAQIGPDMFLFSLTKDAKLRVWSVSKKECINIEPIHCTSPLKPDGTNLLTYKPASSSSPPLLGLHLALTDSNIFRIYSVSFMESTQLTMTVLFYCSGWDVPLKHFSLTASRILALHDESGTPRVLSLDFVGSDSDEGSWEEAQLIEPSDIDETLFSDPDAFIEFCLAEYTELTLCTALEKLGADTEAEGSVGALLATFARTHEGMGDLDEALSSLHRECETFHLVHSTPLSVSDGVLVMAGHLALLLPNSSDSFLSRSEGLAEVMVKLTELIPADAWEYLQSCTEDVIGVSRDLLSTHLAPESSALLEGLLLNTPNLFAALTEAVSSIRGGSAAPSHTPTLFRSTSGSECLIRAVDTGVFDAHKTFAVLLVCLVYVENEHHGISQADQTLIRRNLLPECRTILDRFRLLQWALSSPVSDSSTTEHSDQFGALAISPGGGEDEEEKPATILHHYLSCRQPAAEYGDLTNLGQLVVGLIRALYPGSEALDLPRFLLTSQYFELLKEYYRRAEDARPALTHLAAQAHAASGDHQTAVGMFINVAKTVDLSSELLSTFVGTPDPNMTLSLQYILKCITMLERSSLHAAIVSLATEATQFTDPTHHPLLYSLAFKHALEGGQFDTAYRAMADNPCPSQKHACLKRFVVVLVESGYAKKLVSYPYHGFQSELVTVLEFKARNSDLRTVSQKNYYNLLFAFHVKNKMYQHAAAAAYEHALRLQCELPGVESLQLQLHCFLSSISCLQLLRTQDAWILEPTQFSDIRVAVNASPKRPRSGDEKSKKATTKLNLITVADLRKGYLMVDSLVKISVLKPDSVKLHNLSPPEVLGLLCSCGLYDQAFLLAEYHDLPAPLSSLTARCISLAKQPSQTTSGYGDWLSYNEVPNTDELGTVERAWLYLQRRVEKDPTWDNLKQVLSQILAAPYPAPFWLLRLCKREDPAATIRLCTQYSNLELAVKLSIGYIGAVSGKETADYGLENSLQSNQPPVYLPYTVFDQVLFQLKGKQDRASRDLYQDLIDETTSHFNLLSRVTEDYELLHRDKLSPSTMT